MRSDRSWRVSNEMPVSVIMPALNAGRFIEAAIRSLLRERDRRRSGYHRDRRWVDRRDQGDRGRPWPATFRRCGSSTTRARVSPPARNTGLDNVRAGCQFVTFLDADDISYPGRIERQRSLLVDDPTIDVLYGVMQHVQRA